uniref:Uncharacterized protein n=2 Tax=Oxyrrhis marina TaxID=2969 RepID=A0A7S4GM08_OXYMA
MRVLALVLSLSLALSPVPGGKASDVKLGGGSRDEEEAVLTESTSEHEEHGEQKAKHEGGSSSKAAKASPSARLGALVRHQRAWNARWRRSRAAWLKRSTKSFRARRGRLLRGQASTRRKLRSAYGRSIVAHWRGNRPKAVIRTALAYQRRLSATIRSQRAVLRGQWSRYVSSRRRFVKSQALRWRRRQAWYRQRRGLLIQLRNIRRAVGRTARTMRVVRSRSAAWRRRWSAAVRGRMAHYNRVLRARLTRAVRKQVARRRSLRAAYGRVVMRQWRAKQPNNVIRTVRRFQAALKRSNSAHSRRLGAIRRGIVNAKRRYRAGQNRRLASYNKRVKASLSRLGRTIRSLRSRASRVRRALKSNKKRKVAF